MRFVLCYLCNYVSDNTWVVYGESNSFFMLCFSGKVLTYLIHLLEVGPDESIYPDITVLCNLVCSEGRKRCIYIGN